MKKILIFICLTVFLLGVAPVGVRAAGSASLSGPSVVRAGDTIAVTFYAGGNSGGNGTISYDSAVLTLQSTAQVIGAPYVVQFNGNNFLFWDDSRANPISGSTAIFKLTFSVNANVQPGTKVSVSATGVTLSDGSADTGIGTVSYSTTVAPPLSDNCNLRSMTVTGATVSPAFSPSVTGYNASVPFTTSKIDVSAVAEHEKAKVSIQNPALTPGGTTTVQITVTAQKGNTKTYKIAVFRAQDPNYVPSTNKELKALTVEGYALSPAFDKAVTRYYVWLPYETQDLSLSAQAEDTKAKAEVGTFSLIPGVGVDIPITVTAEDGSQKVYTVTAVRAPEHEKTEEYLTGQREPLPEEPEPTQAPTEKPAGETEPTLAGAETTGETEPGATEVKSSGYSLTVLVIVGTLALLTGVGSTVLCLRRRIFRG